MQRRETTQRVEVGVLLDEFVSPSDPARTVV